MVKGLHDGVPQEGAYVFVVVYQVYSQDVGAGGYGEARHAGWDAVLVAYEGYEDADGGEQRQAVVRQSLEVHGGAVVYKMISLTEIAVQRQQQECEEVQGEVDYVVVAEPGQRVSSQVSAYTEHRYG